MPHSSTITDLCHKAGVTWDDSEQLLQTKGDILLYVPPTRDRRVERGQRGGAASRNGAPPQPQPQPQQAQSGRRKTAHERLYDLERMMRCQWLITREHMAYVHDLNVVLARRFPPSAGSDDQFTPPPAWSHQPAEDDFMDYDDESQDVDSES